MYPTKSLICALVVLFNLAAFAAPSTPAASAPDPIAAALADPARPAADRARDAQRKPASVLALAGVQAGQRVVDIGPGAGYYTRLLSRIVGPQGQVLAFNPTWLDRKFPKARDGVAALIASGYGNLTSSIQPMAEIAFDAPVDLVFFVQLYHDQHWQHVDIVQMNQAIFRALRPGGVYFIVDHRAPAGTTDAQIDQLHRIDPAVVRREVLAAGFTLEAESDLLRNPQDPLTSGVFDPAIRGQTDQFILKFRKPSP